MTAKSLARFNALAQRSDEALDVGPDLQPAVVKIDGVDYGGEAGGVSAILGEARWMPNPDGGGIFRTQQLTLSVSKLVLESPPNKDSIIIFNGITFIRPFIDGYNATDAAWSINALRK